MGTTREERSSAPWGTAREDRVRWGQGLQLSLTEGGTAGCTVEARHAVLDVSFTTDSKVMFTDEGQRLSYRLAIDP
jgi:hypothetical protein